MYCDVIAVKQSEKCHCLIMQGNAWTHETIMGKLRIISNKVLGIDVMPNQPLMESGLDSLAAVELQNAIVASFPSQKLPVTFVYDYPTLDAMAQFFFEVEVHSKRVEAPSRIVGNTTANESINIVSQSTEIINISCRYHQEISGMIFNSLISNMRAFAINGNDGGVIPFISCIYVVYPSDLMSVLSMTMAYM